jgi:hypothetical protein
MKKRKSIKRKSTVNEKELRKIAAAAAAGAAAGVTALVTENQEERLNYKIT